MGPGAQRRLPGQADLALLRLPEPRASFVAQMVKNPPAVQETWVQSSGQEDPLKKGMLTHSSILAWRIPRTLEPGGLQCPWTAKSWAGLSTRHDGCPQKRPGLG